MTQQQKYITQIVTIIAVFYVVIFLLWNYTSPDSQKPSGVLWDFRKQGYQENPLDDRYGTDKP